VSKPAQTHNTVATIAFRRCSGDASRKALMISTIPAQSLITDTAVCLSTPSHTPLQGYVQ